MTMTAAPPVPVPAARPEEGAAPGLYRLTVDQIHQMLDTGILPEDRGVEFIDGQLVIKMVRNGPHIVAVQLGPPSTGSDDSRRLACRQGRPRGHPAL